MSASDLAAANNFNVLMLQEVHEVALQQAREAASRLKAIQQEQSVNEPVGPRHA